MTTQHIETLIIGAGQAGLSTGYHLQRLGRPFLIVDGHERIGDNWRQQWDTLKLYSPAKYDGLPGLPFPAPPWSFPGKEQVADYLESYALRADLPVRMSTRVHRLESRPGGGFTASLGEDTITCDNVVVATGTFGRHPERARLRGRARPVDPSAALQRVPPACSARARTRPGGRRVPLGLRHRLRGGRAPADDAGRPRTAARSRSAGTPGSCAAPSR